MTSSNTTQPIGSSRESSRESSRDGVRTFVVAHDLSSFAEEAADTALDDLLDSRRGGRLVLVHVVEVYIPAGAIDFVGMAPGYAAIEQHARAAAVSSMEHVAERLRAREKLVAGGSSPVAIESVVRVGASADGVLEEAAARRASRIYVGTHGRSGLSRIVLGSVAERIARRAAMPVVVVHGTRADADVDTERAA